MKYILISNDHEIANYAHECGVDRIMVDTETLGKQERQKSVNAVFNTHNISDVSIIKDHSKIDVICRINKLNSRSNIEIDKAIDHGADYIMVPMIRDELDIHHITKLINGRIKFIPLLEQHRV